MAESSAAAAAASTAAEAAESSKARAAERIQRRSYIRNGDNVLLRLPSEAIKPVTIRTKDNLGLGKYGKIACRELIGRTYGDTYEILDDGKLKSVKATIEEIQETEASNEFIKSTGAQKITDADIEDLRKQGLSGREIIQRQIEEHAAYDLKTEFSKAKYMKRKEAKYIRLFTPLPPTAHTICDFNFDRQPPRTRGIRADTLAQMLTMANVRPHARTMVVEDVAGLVVGASLERMGGEGLLMYMSDTDSPPDCNILKSFNFDDDDMAPFQYLSWAATDSTYEMPDLPLEVPAAGLTAQKLRREREKIARRKAVYDRADKARQEYTDGEFESLILACEYDPYSIIERVLPALAGSAAIVVYSQHLGALQSLFLSLRSNPSFISVTIHEPWLRKYQVLPGRTHPEMNGMAHGGFYLSAIRVFDDENAVASEPRKPKRAAESSTGPAKRQKVDDNEGKATGQAVALQ